MKNQFNILTLFGILMLGVSLAMLGFAGQFYAERYDVLYPERQAEYWARIGFFIAGIAMTILSVGLLLRYKWSRIGLIAAHVTGLIVWTVFLISIMKSAPSPWFAIGGLSAFVYCFLIFGLFFLNNKYVLEHFEDHHYKNEDHPEILDL